MTSHVSKHLTMYAVYVVTWSYVPNTFVHLDQWFSTWVGRSTSGQFDFQRGGGVRLSVLSLIIICIIIKI